jgi:hypothetical protein
MDGRRYGNADAREIGADRPMLTPREREVAELLRAGASYALRALRTPRAPEPWGRHPGPSRSLANARRVTVRGLGQLNDRQSNHTAHAGSGIYR